MRNRLTLRLSAILLPLILLFCFMNANLHAAEPSLTQKTELATLGGGCFWCLDAGFRLLPGVKKVVSGYAGGQTVDPSYEEVCTGTTGHAEVVQIEYDPSVISYEKLLNYFWKIHDPTTLNAQGHDHGTQYRSIILYQSEAQKIAAEKSKKEIAAQLKAPVVTEIVPLQKFYPAEISHQDYYARNPNAGYCRMVIKPKLDKLK